MDLESLSLRLRHAIEHDSVTTRSSVNEIFKVPGLFDSTRSYKVAEITDICVQFVKGFRELSDDNKQKIEDKNQLSKTFPDIVKKAAGYFEKISAEGETPSLWNYVYSDQNHSSTENHLEEREPEGEIEIQQGKIVIGDGKHIVYAWSLPLYRVHRNNDDKWPIKIGFSSNTISQRIPMTDLPEKPDIWLVFRFDMDSQAKKHETSLHLMLENRSKRIEKTEWFLTNPATILDLMRTVNPDLVPQDCTVEWD